MFTHMNTWMVGKNSIRHHYLKQDFYGHLNMEDITDADYTYAKRVCKNFEIKNLGEYLDFYFQSNTSFLADIFANFRNVSWNI